MYGEILRYLFAKLKNYWVLQKNLPICMKSKQKKECPREFTDIYKYNTRNFIEKKSYIENSVRAVISREICSCPFFIAFGHDVQKRKGEL